MKKYVLVILAVLLWCQLAFASGGAQMNALDTVVHGAARTIDTVHSEVHQGHAFTTADYDDNVDIVTPKYWRITTPDTAVRIHFAVSVECSGGCLIQFFENPTLDAAGSALTEFNNDRNSATAAVATTFEDTTTTGDGTQLLVIKTGGGAVPASNIGGTARTQFEWILKQNEDYLVKVTADADDTLVAIQMQWYEE